MTQLSWRRWAMLACAVGAAVGAVRLFGALAPGAPGSVGFGFAFAALLGGGAAALAAEDETLKSLLVYFALATAAVLLLPLATHDAKAASQALGVASTMAMAAAGFSAVRRARRFRYGVGRGAVLLGLALIAVLSALCAYRILASQPLMFSDYMDGRLLSIFVADALRAGRFGDLAALFVQSMPAEYSLLPALAPGVALAASAPLSRALYFLAIAAFYATPAFLALGLLGREIARRAVGSARWGRCGGLAVATGAAIAACPGAVTIVALGMPDIGGLALFVVGLRLSDQIARLAAAAPGRDAWLDRTVTRAALMLAVCLFAMFLFRRWYAFAAVGIVASLAIEIGLLALARGRRLRWRSVVAAAAAGSLALVGLAAPVVIAWLPDWSNHDYATIYAGYNFDVGELVHLIGVWYGLAIVAAALASAVFLAARGRDRRLLRLTVGASAIAFALLLHVQSPSMHHLYVIVPALAAPIGAATLALFDRKPRAAGLAVLGIAIFTLTPAAGAFSSLDLFPTANLPPPPRADLAELARLRAWTQDHATPERRYCVLASSVVISDVLVDELWQLDPVRAPIFDPALKNDVAMPRVDGRDGPPDARLKSCVFLLVGDPVQTSLVKEFQLSVAIPAAEALAGEGIGRRYRRTGDVFDLVGGVKLVVLERTAPLNDEDIAELQARWRTAPRGEAARRAAQRFF